MAGAKTSVIFCPNTTYYRSHFALKTIIQLVSERDEPSSRNFQLNFAPVWSDICQMLRWYGAQQVGRLWSAPDTLMEVQFASDKTLKKFLQSKRKVETAMVEIITKRFFATKPQDASTTFKASTVLLLVTPNGATATTEFRPVTLANHRNCVSLYIESKIAELPAEPATMLKTVPEDVLTENDLPELMKLLSDIVDWYGLGLVLGIPYSKLQMMESDFSGAQVGRTLRLLSYVLVEWIQNHQEATWSTLVHALSSIGKRPAARRIALEFGVHVPDVSVLDDLSPEKSERLQQILEEIKQLVNSKSSDMELVRIQNAIEEAQQKKQLTLETFGSILKDTISKVKMLLTQKENLEKQISKKEKQLNDKEKQLQQLREGQCATALETTASSLKQEVSELKQQLLETDQQLNAARVQHSNEVFKKSVEISALSNQTCQLMGEKDALVADLDRKMTLIRSLETSSKSLNQLSANLQFNLDMALQQQQRLTSQILQQEEQHKREVTALREDLQEQRKQDEQHSSGAEAFKTLEQLSDDALKHVASAIEIGTEYRGKGKDTWEYKAFTISSAEVMEKLSRVPLAGRIADKLSAAGTIGEYVKQLAYIHAPGVTEVDRIRPIIATLKDKIQQDVQIYHHFRGILLSLGADADTALHYLPEEDPTHNAKAAVIPSTPSTPPLPKGWTEHKTDDGHSYYHNHVTGKSTWTRPQTEEPHSPEKTLERVTPRGWTKEITPFSSTPIFTNNRTGERWALARDGAGIYYYYNLSNPSLAVGELPEFDDTPTPQPVTYSDLEFQLPRHTHDKLAQSLPARTLHFQAEFQSSSKKHGYLFLNKRYDAEGKRVRTLWGSWQKCYTVLVDSTLQFYSIHKVVKKTPEAKPQYTFFLRHATVTPYTKEKRKNVFQVTSTDGEQILLQAETPLLMNDWYSAIQTAIDNVLSQNMRPQSIIEEHYLPDSQLSFDAEV